ncbi:MAG: DUF1318 domain-containing protein [Thermodesulfobacteriota bacterium]
MSISGSNYVGLFILAGVLCLSSCAIITINVNFPAQEVRKAYEDLEDELLKEPEEEDAGEEAPQGSPESIPEPSGRESAPLEQPPGNIVIQLRKVVFITELLNLDVSPRAWAQDDLAGEIGKQIRSMPEVLKAYKSRSRRLSSVNSMLASGIVGEGKNGLLVKRGSLTRAQAGAMNDENSDRGVIIKGMAVAILKIRSFEVNSQNINEVYPKAAAEFAATRRTKAKRGAWIQSPKGSWNRR